MGITRPLDSDPEEVRAVLAPLRHDFTVALHAAENAFAVGAIIRVAHNFLAREIVLIGDAPYYEKASMGMEKYETVTRVADEQAFLAHVGKRPLWAIEKDHATTSLHGLDALGGFPRDVVLLFGSERFGIPEALIGRASVVVGIPIYGVNHSLPLAVAAGIVMNEWARRKYAGGRVVT
jgi:tRNA G18 (ribose-2'-O)-methylase SpoU